MLQLILVLFFLTIAFLPVASSVGGGDEENCGDNGEKIMMIVMEKDSYKAQLSGKYFCKMTLSPPLSPKSSIGKCKSL